MQRSDLVRKCLDRAERDAATAEFLLQMRLRPDEIICKAELQVEGTAFDETSRY